MNSTKIQKLTLLLMGLLMFSCVKQPVADFSISSSEYMAGDYVSLSNNSSDAKTYKWTFPDGTTSTSANPSYYVPSYYSPGSYTIKLEAINGSKKDTREKSFSVIASTGSLMVWTATSSYGQMSVQIDGSYAGTITSYYPSGTPSCGSTGCVNIDLTPGSHSIYATAGSYHWGPSTVNITAGQCLRYQLY